MFLGAGRFALFITLYIVANWTSYRRGKVIKNKA